MIETVDGEVRRKLRDIRLGIPKVRKINDCSAIRGEGQQVTVVKCEEDRRCGRL